MKPQSRAMPKEKAATSLEDLEKEKRQKAVEKEDAFRSELQAKQRRTVSKEKEIIAEERQHGEETQEPGR